MSNNFDNNNGNGYEFEIIPESCKQRLQRRGIVAVHTDLKQFPHADNGNFAVVRSRLETRAGHGFSFLGSASPSSLNKNAGNDAILGAATLRAIKGALSMAEACSLSADTSPAPLTAPTQTSHQPQVQPPFTKNHSIPRGPRQGQLRHHRTEPGSMSGSQRNVLEDIARKKGITLEEMFASIGTTVEDASSANANDLMQMHGHPQRRG